MTQVGTMQHDQLDLGAALDRWAPGLLGLALAFTPEPTAAHRMVERGWLAALRRGELDAPTGVRAAVVRAMALPGADDDPAVGAGARELRHALLAAGVLVLPRQRERRPAATVVPVAGPPALHLDDLRRLPGPLRLVLLLVDVQRWPAAEVEDLLGVRPAARRSILGHARRALLAQLRASGAPA